MSHQLRFSLERRCKYEELGYIDHTIHLYVAGCHLSDHDRYTAKVTVTPSN
jgi:hypothetical protein